MTPTKYRIYFISFCIGKSTFICDNSNPKVMDKHYTAQIEVIKKSSLWRIFSTSEERVN